MGDGIADGGMPNMILDWELLLELDARQYVPVIIAAVNDVAPQFPGYTVKTGSRYIIVENLDASSGHRDVDLRWVPGFGWIGHAYDSTDFVKAAYKSPAYTAPKVVSMDDPLLEPYWDRNPVDELVGFVIREEMGVEKLLLELTNKFIH